MSRENTETMKTPNIMDLDRQIQLLIDNAPPDRATKGAIAQAVAPVLKEIASQLQSLEYYIVQSLEGEWVLTTLRNRAQPKLEKTALYAFSTFKDAIAFQGNSKTGVTAIPLPVVQILFQLFALDRVESLIIMDTPGNLVRGTEIHRRDLQKLVQQKLQQLQGNFPSDLAWV